MRNSVSDVTDAEILDETREAMTQAAFDAADEANAAQAVESATESLPAFDELGLSDEMLRAIENLGYTAPTPVQAGLDPRGARGSRPACRRSNRAPARRPPSCCRP